MNVHRHYTECMDLTAWRTTKFFRSFWRAGHSVYLFPTHASLLVFQSQKNVWQPNRYLEDTLLFSQEADSLEFIWGIVAAFGEMGPALSRYDDINLNIVNAACLCQLADFCNKSWAEGGALIKGQLWAICCLVPAIIQGQPMMKGILISIWAEPFKSWNSSTELSTLGIIYGFKGWWTNENKAEVEVDGCILKIFAWP